MSTYYANQPLPLGRRGPVVYLGIDNTGSTNDHFISYDDEHACQAKVIYARARGIGGV